MRLYSSNDNSNNSNNKQIGRIILLTLLLAQLLNFEMNAAEADKADQKDVEHYNKASVTASSPRQRLNNSTTDDVTSIFAKLHGLPVAHHYPELLTRCRPILQRWHDAWHETDPKLWTKIRRALPKEINESAFVLDELTQFVEAYTHESDRPLVIVDLCSGIGLLSMLLSHLLPPHKVVKICAVDVLFPSHVAKVASANADENDNGGQPQQSPKHHLPTHHLTARDVHPIAIQARKVNLKKRREWKQILQHVVRDAPAILVGIHLCKSLSVHAVRLWHAACNNNDNGSNNNNALRLYLKPCCLPGRRDLQRKHPPFWEFAHMKETTGGVGVQLLYCPEITTRATTSTSNSNATTTRGENRDTTTATTNVNKNDQSARLVNAQTADDDVDIDYVDDNVLHVRGYEVDDEDNDDLVTESKKPHTQKQSTASSSLSPPQPEQQAPPRGKKTNALYNRWVHLLCEAAGHGATIHTSHVQEHHFLNQYIVAVAPGSTTITG